MSDTVFFSLLMLGVVLAVAFVGWDAQRKRKRKESLRRTDNGSYVWVDFDGSTKSSRKHPEEKGGAWDSESGTGGGDGGGGGGE